MTDPYDIETEAREYVDIPRWIEQDIAVSQIAAILEGGCESGAYMPAVTYADALNTMSEHGDDICEYIEDTLGELPDLAGQTWSTMACTLMSTAVELWATSAYAEIEDALEDEAEEGCSHDHPRPHRGP